MVELLDEVWRMVKGRSWAECGECGRLEGYGTKIMLKGVLCVVGY